MFIIILLLFGCENICIPNMQDDLIGEKNVCTDNYICGTSTLELFSYRRIAESNENSLCKADFVYKSTVINPEINKIGFEKIYFQSENFDSFSGNSLVGQIEDKDLFVNVNRYADGQEYTKIFTSDNHDIVILNEIFSAN